MDGSGDCQCGAIRDQGERVMVGSQLAVTQDGLLLCASASACSLLGIDNAQDLTERARPWLDQEAIRMALAEGLPPSADGFVEIAAHDALRLQLRGVPGAAAVLLAVLIDPLQNDARL